MLRVVSVAAWFLFDLEMSAICLWKFLINSILIVALRPVQYRPRIHLNIYSDKSYYGLPIMPTVESFDDCLVVDTVSRMDSAAIILSKYNEIFDADVYELKQKVNRQVAISLDHLHEWERDEIMNFMWSRNDPSATNLRLKVIELTNLYEQVQRLVDTTETEPKHLMGELRALRNKLRMTLGESTELRSVLAVKQFENHTGVRVMKNVSQSFQQFVLTAWKIIGQLVMTLMRPFLWLTPNKADPTKDFAATENKDVTVEQNGMSILSSLPWNKHNAASTATNALDSDNHCTI